MEYQQHDQQRLSVDVHLLPEEEYISRFRFSGHGPSEAAMDKMISQMTTGTLASWQAAQAESRKPKAESRRPKAELAA